MEAGSVVRIKSGGPKMTIQAINGDNVVCVWFDNQNNPQKQIFKINTLEIAE